MFNSRLFSLFFLFFLFACEKEYDFPSSEQSPQPIVINLSSSASKIGLGVRDIELSWIADNADSCGAYGDWSGWVPVSGNASITPTSSGQKVFSLHCVNEGYVETASVVVDIDNPPSISAAGIYVVDENSTFVGSFSGTDPDDDPLVADIFGDDAELFEIVLNDQNTFDIVFKDAPDYEKPSDSNSDNSYEVRLSVFDGTTGSDAETIINVQDVVAYTLVGENLIEFPANSSGTQDAHAVSKDGSHIAVIGYDFSEGEANAVGVNARLFKLNESNNSWALIETFELNSQPLSQDLGVGGAGDIMNSVDFIETDNVFGLVFGVPFCIHVDSGFTNGCVYTYFLSQDGVWSEEAVIFDGDDISDNFGFSVDVSSDGSLLAVGAPSPERNGGAVHTFELEGKIIGPKTYRFESDSYFGADVSLSGSGAKLAVGAPGGYFSPLSDSPGTVTIIHIPTGLDFVISGDYPGDNFGNEVSLSGDGSKVAVGASTTQTPEEVTGVFGAAYVFNANTGEQIGNMLVSPFEDSGWFGHGLDISSDGRFLAVGSPPGSHPYGAAPGHTMLYKYMENEGWVLYKDFYPTNENFGFYGWDVEFSSDNKRLSITSTDFYVAGDATGYIEVYDISEAGILLSDAILNPEPVVSKIPKTERFGNIFQQIKK